MAMKNDKYFRNSVILADIVLFAILCYIGVLGTATFAGHAVVAAGILLTATAFVTLCDLSMNWAEKRTAKLLHA